MRRDGVLWLIIVTGIVAIAAFAIVHGLGWRSYTTVLSGTLPGETASWDAAVPRGVAYVLAWFGLVLVAPICGLAAVLYGVTLRFLRPVGSAASVTAPPS